MVSLISVSGQFRRRLRNFIFSFWSGFLGIGYTLLLPLALLVGLLFILFFTAVLAQIF